MLQIYGSDKKLLVFISIGRSVDMDFGIDVKVLPYDFIFTEGVNIKEGNSYKLPVETNNLHNYIKASDYIITKAGWSTVAEAVCAHKPMLVIDRTDFVEDRNTKRHLFRLGIAEKINVSNLNKEDILYNLRKLEDREKEYHGLSDRYKDSPGEITKKILQLLI